MPKQEGTEMNHKDIAQPYFEPDLVVDNLDDGYWLEAVDINGDGKPDLVASGLAEGEVVWYENPGGKKHLITTFPKPVALDQADVYGEGRMDLVICHDYGTCMYNCRPEDGKISWLENPGSYDGDEEWAVHHIADLMATHRIRCGYFTQLENLELLALPVVDPEGVHEPIQVTLLSQPDDPTSAGRWEGRVVDDSSFRIIHGVLVDRLDPDSDLDSVLLASEEGLTWFYNGTDGGWHRSNLASGSRARFRRPGSRTPGTSPLAG